MTDKRFTINMEDECIDDAKNEIFIDFNDKIDFYQLCELLNEQHETIERLKQNVEELLSVSVEKELFEENEQLKQAYTQLKHRHSLLHDVCIDAECDRDSYRKDIVSLEEENEQLKEQNADWETAFDNCKHYKEAYGTEIVKIKQTIKDMMEKNNYGKRYDEKRLNNGLHNSNPNDRSSDNS